MKFGIEKICHAHHEKWKKTNNGRNRTAQLRKNPVARIKGNLHILGNIGSRPHETNGKERKKIRKTYLRITRKLLETKLSSQDLILTINTHAFLPPCRILGIILKMDNERIQMDQRKRKLMTMHKAFTSEKTRIQRR